MKSNEKLQIDKQQRSFIMKKKISILAALMLVVSIIQVPLFACSSKACCAVRANSGISSENRQTTSRDITEIAASDDRFKTLTAALEAAGLIETLKGTGPFTVFAPTDEAFAKLAPGTIDELLKPENKDALRNILTYHVFPGRVTAADAAKLDGKEVTMVNDEKAKIEVRDGSVFIDGAKVIIPDLMAKNGIIHVIDTVMMPPTD